MAWYPNRLVPTEAAHCRARAVVSGWPGRRPARHCRPPASFSRRAVLRWQLRARWSVMADCGHPLHRTRGRWCPCSQWTAADDRRVGMEPAEAAGKTRGSTMIIYLATSGEYIDYQVCHAFAKREDAESYKLGDDVKEMEVRDGPVEVRTWHTLNWR